jgi:hypothetical protein
MRVLFVVNRCKKNQMQYVRSIAARCDGCHVIISYLGHENTAQYGLLEPNDAIPSITVLHPGQIREGEIDLARFRDEVRAAIGRLKPDVVHCLYYYHDALTVEVRGVLAETGHPAALIYETRDPTYIHRPKLPERQALDASDGYIFATRAIVDDLFARTLKEHEPHLIVRQSESYADRDAVPTKLSAGDGRTHVGLLGSFSEDPTNGRHYDAYFDAFLASTRNTVLHVFPHLRMPYLDAAVARHGGRLVLHWEDRPYVGRVGQLRNAYTSTVGRLDFNLVAHVLGRPQDDREMLRVCNPTKATSPLVLADLPVLCLPHYRGVVDLIDEFGCGYVYRGWRDLDALLNDRSRWPPLIEAARRAARAICHEAQAERIEAFYRTVRERRFGAAASRS